MRITPFSAFHFGMTLPDKQPGQQHGAAKSPQQACSPIEMFALRPLQAAKKNRQIPCKTHGFNFKLILVCYAPGSRQKPVCITRNIALSSQHCFCAAGC